MILLRCSAKLLKRMRQPAKPPEPLTPSENPLGEWMADIDFIDRQPFAMLMNAATGTVLVLPARAADLRQLHVIAGKQLHALLDVVGIRGALAAAEVDAWQHPPVIARTVNRSLTASMNQRRFDAWTQFAYNRSSAFEVALRMNDTPFTRKDLGRGYFYAAHLLRARLEPAGKNVSALPTRVLH